MPDVQGTYDQYPEGAYEGQKATQSNATIVSRKNGTGAEFFFGRVVCQSATDGEGELGGANRFVGISIREHNVAAETPNGVRPNDQISCMVKGEIWVRVKEAVTPLDPATYDPADGQLNTSGTAIAGAYYATTAAIGELAKLQLA